MAWRFAWRTSATTPLGLPTKARLVWTNGSRSRTSSAAFPPRPSRATWMAQFATSSHGRQKSFPWTLTCITNTQTRHHGFLLLSSSDRDVFFHAFFRLSAVLAAHVRRCVYG